MFLLYPFLFVASYWIYKNHSFHGDSEDRWMQHVLSCVSYMDADKDTAYPERRRSSRRVPPPEITDLSYRRIPKGWMSGNDMRYINQSTPTPSPPKEAIITKEAILWNLLKLDLLYKLQNPDSSLLQKMHILNLFESTYDWGTQVGKYSAGNIFAGNLLDDWEGAI